MRWSRRFVFFAGTSLLAVFLPLSAMAQVQVPKLENLEKNIGLCSGAAQATPETQVTACTAVIESGAETKQSLAIAHNNRGNAHNRQGQYDRAIEDYNSSIDAKPDYAKAFNNRGVAYQKKGEYDKAIADFDESIRLTPTYAGAFANRAETYRRKGDYRTAVRDYDEAIRLQPTLIGVLNGRCWSRAIIGELQAALA